MNSLKLTTLILLVNNIAIGNKAFAQGYNKHQWQNRVLIIETQSVNSSTYRSQIDVLDEVAMEMLDRKIVLYQIEAEQEYFTDYQNGQINKIKLSSSQRLNSDQRQKSPFNFTLIGLDGSIKLSRSSMVSTQELFALIDAMPMRKAEIKKDDQY